MKLGLKKLRCKECGTEREVETGIRIMYCCAQKMVDVTEEEEKIEKQEPTLRLNPRQ